MGLNDLEICVIATKSMRFTTHEALEYLKTQNHHISERTYFRVLGHVSSETRKRSFEIAKSFLEEHIHTIDELLYVKKLMYQEYVKESDSLKKTMILSKIVETMIPYISAYREATKEIIKKVKKEVGTKEEHLNLSSLGV